MTLVIIFRLFQFLNLAIWIYLKLTFTRAVDPKDVLKSGRNKKKIKQQR